MKYDSDSVSVVNGPAGKKRGLEGCLMPSVAVIVRIFCDKCARCARAAHLLATTTKHSFGAPMLSHGEASSAQILRSDVNVRTYTCAL